MHLAFPRLQFSAIFILQSSSFSTSFGKQQDRAANLASAFTGILVKRVVMRAAIAGVGNNYGMAHSGLLNRCTALEFELSGFAIVVTRDSP